MAETEELKAMEQELAKLPPEERIAKLKELEEKKKAEMKRVEEIIRQSVSEAKIQKEEQVKVLLHKMKAAGADKEKPREATLEETVGEAKVDLSPEQLQQIRYGVPRDIMETRNPDMLGNNAMYGRLKEIRNRASQGYMSQQDSAFLQEFEQSMQGVNPNYAHDAQIKENLTRAEYALKQIEGYKTSMKGQNLNKEEHQ